jgi:phenylacetate-CoA ligase
MAERMIPEMSLDEKEQLKLERLQSTLNRAYKNVPFHRSRFEDMGILPQDIVSLANLSQLPFMDRSHLGTHYPYGLFAVPLRDIVRIHTAPGTGANPSISGYTKADLLIWKNLVARSYEAAGVTDMDIIQIHLPPGLANWGRDYKDGGETLGAGVIPNSTLSLSKTLMVLRDYKTTTLVTTPAFATTLTTHLFDTQCHPSELNLKRIILVGEPVEKKQIRNLSDRLYVDVWQNYGLSEIPGPAIAHECTGHNGLHINDDHILPEIVDPATGRPLSPGQKGELVLTTLSARAFPLIRFRTGDTASILSDPCNCSCCLQKIQWDKERTDGMMIISGIKVGLDRVRQSLQSALKLDRPDCSIKRILQGGTDILGVSLVMDDRFFSDEIKDLEKLMAQTEATLAEQTGVTVKISLIQKRN